MPISVPNPHSQLADAANHLFWAGDAFWIEASEAPVLANAGAVPADILLIDVVPLSDGTAATPAPHAAEPPETRSRSMLPVQDRLRAPSQESTCLSC